MASSEQTTKRHLNKPQPEDFVNVINDICDNMDNLDDAVPDSRKVNGHTLNGDITVSKSDVGLGNVDNVQQVPATRKVNNKALSSDINLQGTDIQVSSSDSRKVDAAIAKCDSETASLKSALNNTTGNVIIDEWQYGHFIYTNTSPINMSTAVGDHNDYRYALIECNPGDKFTINIYAGQTALGWSFLDSSYNILYKASGAIDVENYVISAPVGTKYLLLNDRKTYKPFRNCYYGEYLKNAVGELKEIVSVSPGDFVIGLPNDKTNTTRIFNLERINLTKCSRIKVTGKPNCLYVYGYDEQNKLIKTYNWDTYNNDITVENDGYYVLVIRKSTDNEAISSGDIAAQVGRITIIGNHFYKNFIENDDIEKITGNKIIQGWNYGQYIISNVATVDITSIGYHPDYRYTLIDCNEGDVFTLNVACGSTARAWNFLDDEYKVLSQPSGSETATNKVLIAPEDAAYLLLNDKITSSGYKNSYYGEIGEKSDLPLYWRNYLDTKLSQIQLCDAEIGFNGDSFVFITDSHQPSNAGYSPRIVQEIVKNTAVKKVVFGGDCVNSPTHDQGIGLFSKWRNGFSGIDASFIMGNHEQMYTDPDNGELYGIFMRNKENENVYATEKLYGYTDNDAQKIRYIFLDSSKGTTSFDSTQIAWMKERISELSNGWSVVIFTHYYYNVTRDGWHGESIFVHDVGTAINTAIGDIINSINAKIIAVICGHCHTDYSTASEYGYPIISTTCDSYVQQITFNDPPEITRTLGTITEQAFDVIHINKDTKTITYTRIGAGSETRTFTYN